MKVMAVSIHWQQRFWQHLFCQVESSLDRSHSSYHTHPMKNNPSLTLSAQWLHILMSSCLPFYLHDKRFIIWGQGCELYTICIFCQKLFNADERKISLERRLGYSCERVWLLCSDQVLLYWPPICWSNQPLAWQHCYNNVNHRIYSDHHNLSDDERYIKAYQQQRNYTPRKYINVLRKTLQTRCNMWILRVLLIGSITVFLTCCSVDAHKDDYGMWILVWFYYSISSYTNCVRVCSLPI